jgi:hypothetical protein
MSYRTLEALKERKLDNWLKKGIITKQQYKDICYYCGEYGFWEALGYATYLKYKNNPQLKKKYEYKWLNIPKKEYKFNDYVTFGAFSSRKCKRHRIWYNGFFCKDGTYMQDKIKKDYPNWEIFYLKQDKFRIGLRRVISDKLGTLQ